MALLTLEQISFNYQTADSPLFDGLGLTLEKGDCQLIYGHTGSGKSSLLKLILGILERPFEGECRLAAGVSLGVVLQDPNSQLLRQNVGSEVAFALENLGIPPEAMGQRVTLALRQVGLFVRLDTPIHQLSLGQRYRLMIAAQLVLQPSILLLDEPWAQLDDKGVSELTQLIIDLQAQGMAIVITEHQKRVFLACATHRWQLRGGRLEPYVEQAQPITSVTSGPRKIDRQASPLIHSQGFSLRFTDDTLLFTGRELMLYPGEVVALVGDNGAGKSSLLKCLAGIQADMAAVNIKVLDKPPKLGRYGSALALLHQRPSRQLFESSVIEEMQFSLQRYGLPLSRADELLARLELGALVTHSPHKLSYGQQHLLALASLVCLRPKVLLLDDPFAGLDRASFSKVVNLLIELSQQGTAIVIASHRPIPGLTVDTLWRIDDRQLQICSPEGSLHGDMSYACVG
ncbi:energy-coupling factor ABC transporter ATP-binding protein [Shewanella sp. AS1]|uniref:ATP-binding cassette domain-containing protein n=1 Tax=Shewanella sp. AS1 TaxID=2907626 RepID=UPI001F3A7A10|nr:ABC transporter ATP-binding protein [Shewanella sp. AS1]MCE9680408.1 energy-coupling factor ABC transporter ATP-binding protein [Shewanella sp. AS1]